MAIKILKPGLLTTIQDLGRKGFRKDGIIVSGAMDSLALRVGNLLLGNEENECGIECSMLGPEILFEADQLIAITGANLSPKIDGIEIKMWRPVLVAKNSVLSFGAVVHGCYAYISFFKGLAIPEVLGSKATYLRAGLGGWEGRALKTGDTIGFNHTYNSPQRRFNWFADPTTFYDPYDSSIRVVPGPEFEWFTNAARREFLTNDFQITREADRMGYRLKGPALELKQKRELLSSAVTFGTIQVTGNGSPIVLMADHQTTGGYPRIAQVINADLPRLAQLKTGDRIQFCLTDIRAAQELYLQRENKITQLKQALYFKQ